jgi:hypothetical protein
LLPLAEFVEARFPVAAPRFKPEDSYAPIMDAWYPVGGP